VILNIFDSNTTIIIQRPLWALLVTQKIQIIKIKIVTFHYSRMFLRDSTRLKPVNLHGLKKTYLA